MWLFFFLQAEDGIRDLVRSRGLGDVYKRPLRGGGLIALLRPRIPRCNVEPRRNVGARRRWDERQAQQERGHDRTLHGRRGTTNGQANQLISWELSGAVRGSPATAKQGAPAALRSRGHRGEARAQVDSPRDAGSGLCGAASGSVDLRLSRSVQRPSLRGPPTPRAASAPPACGSRPGGGRSPRP